MPGQGSEALYAGTIAVERIVMVLLLSGAQPGPWSRSELELEAGYQLPDLAKALENLRGAGLVHLCGELVFLSRAARRMDDLDL